MNLRLVLLLVILSLIPACRSGSSGSRADDDEDVPPLNIGMAAPRLNGGEWLRGEAVGEFKQGQAYVVEFWATWCGPCLASMGHLDDIAATYRDRGLTVIAVSTVDDRGNTLEAVNRYLSGPGHHHNIRFLLMDNFSIQRAYLNASGNMMLPASFVVDREGKVAYIGQPGDLDEVVPRVLAGTWDAVVDSRRMKEREAEMESILGKVEDAALVAQSRAGKGNPKMPAIVQQATEKAAGEASDSLIEFGKKHPGTSSKISYQINLARMQLIAKRYEDARRTCEPILTRAISHQNPEHLRILIETWADRSINPEHRSSDLPVRAADAWLAFDGRSLGSLLMAAQAYYFAGDRKRGMEYSEKTMDAVKDPRQKGPIEQALREFAQP